MTCDGSSTFVSFAAFIQPFKPKLWAGIGAMILTIAIIFCLLFHHQRIKQSALILVLQVVLDKSVYLPDRISNLPGFKPFLVLTMILATICTNLYRGILTTSVTSPLPLSRLEKVEEAIHLGYKIIIPVNSRFAELFIILYDKNSSQPLPDANKTFVIDSLAYYGDDGPLRTLLNKQKQNFPKSKRDSLDAFYNQLHFNFSSKYSPTRHLLECNKTIYLPTPSNLNEVYGTISKSEKEGRPEIYFGKSAFSPHQNVFAVSEMEIDRSGFIYRAIQSGIHSGIFKYMQERGTYKSHPEELTPTIKPVGTNSNLILSIFILFATTALLCFASFTTELILHEISLHYSQTRVTLFKRESEL